MKKIALHIILLLSTLSAQESIVPNIQLVEKPDPCGQFEERRLTITVDIGKVLPSHQLYGFEFELGYDSTKLVFDNVFRQNTFLEYFGENVYVNNYGNLVSGSGGFISDTPVSGDRPLFALSFRLLDDVFDSTYVRLLNLYMFDGYTNEINLTINDTEDIEYEVKESSLQELNITTTDKIEFTKDKIKIIPIEIDSKNISRLEYLSINYSFEEELYLLKDVFSENAEISFDKNSINLTKITTNSNFTIDMVLEQITDSIESNLELKYNNSNLSACVKSEFEKSIRLEPYIKIDTRVEEEIFQNIKIVENIVTNNKSFDIEIFNYLGNSIYKGNDLNIRLEKGLYFIHYNNLTKKIIIN